MILLHHNDLVHEICFPVLAPSSGGSEVPSTKDTTSTQGANKVLDRSSKSETSIDDTNKTQAGTSFSEDKML
jgi:hypothetical protein